MKKNMKNNIKLKIETHKKSNTVGNTISFFADKIKYVKDSVHLHKILKEKLKDRHKIKGIAFSNQKMKHNNKILKKKESSSDLLDIDEANYLISMNNYDKLKHEIYVREKKEKERRNLENLDKELLKRDINYTHLKETIYQFIRFKNKSNLYRANIIKNKIELKLANKISKKNFINQTLKNITLHFNKVRGKVDLGKKPLEESENEYAYKKLVEQIARSRIKYMSKIRNETESNSPTNKGVRKSFMILNRTDKNNRYNNLFDLFRNNGTENSNDNKSISDEKSEKDESKEINDVDDNFEKNDSKSNNDNENDNGDIKQKKKSQIFCKTESNEINIRNINKKYLRDNIKNNKVKRKRKKRHRYFLSDKVLKININDNNNYYQDTNIRTQRNYIKYDTNSNSQSNNNLYLSPETTNFNISNPINNIINSQKVINNNILNNINIDMPNNNLETESNLNSNQNGNSNYDNTSIINKSNINLSKSKQFVKDINNLEKMRKNNMILGLKKRNPLFWNNNMQRLHTAGFRAISNKVTNKPLYTTKIGDLVKEYNRIKTLSKKSKRRMRDKHLTTMEDIDKIVDVKEDLLMFNLKMKYFNCSFPQKKQKFVSKRKIFRKKIKNCVEIIDNPLNGEYEKSNNGSSNEDYY